MTSISSTHTLTERRLTLSGNQDVRNVVDLQRNLTEILPKSGAFVIDCNAIDSLDAACLQILLAAKRDAPNVVQIDAEPTSEAARWIQYSGLANQLFGKSELSVTGS